MRVLYVYNNIQRANDGRKMFRVVKNCILGVLRNRDRLIIVFRRKRRTDRTEIIPRA